MKRLVYAVLAAGVVTSGALAQAAPTAPVAPAGITMSDFFDGAVGMIVPILAIIYGAWITFRLLAKGVKRITGAAF